MTDDEIERHQHIAWWAAWPMLLAGFITIAISIWAEIQPLLYLAALMLGGGAAGIFMRRTIRKIWGGGVHAP